MMFLKGISKGTKWQRFKGTKVFCSGAQQIYFAVNKHIRVNPFNPCHPWPIIHTTQIKKRICLQNTTK